jgi:hypothetical protein
MLTAAGRSVVGWLARQRRVGRSVGFAPGAAGCSGPQLGGAAAVLRKQARGARVARRGGGAPPGQTDRPAAANQPPTDRPLSLSERADRPATDRPTDRPARADRPTRRCHPEWRPDRPTAAARPAGAYSNSTRPTGRCTHQSTNRPTDERLTSSARDLKKNHPSQIGAASYCPPSSRGPPRRTCVLASRVPCVPWAAAAGDGFER